MISNHEEQQGLTAGTIFGHYNKYLFGPHSPFLSSSFVFFLLSQSTGYRTTTSSPTSSLARRAPALTCYHNPPVLPPLTSLEFSQFIYPRNINSQLLWWRRTYRESVSGVYRRWCLCDLCTVGRVSHATSRVHKSSILYFVFPCLMRAPTNTIYRFPGNLINRYLIGWVTQFMLLCLHGFPGCYERRIT